MLWWKRDTETDVDVVSGMFMLVRREAINEVGMMDEIFFVFGEEADWCYRFAESGWKVRFWPGARIIHLGGGGHSTDQASVAMSVQIQKSLLIFVRKHRGKLHYWVARLMLCISFGLRSCICAMLFSLKKLTRGQTNHYTDRLAKSWAVFKFVAVSIQHSTSCH
jgi:GT2 family glycosyltransferase